MLEGAQATCAPVNSSSWAPGQQPALWMRHAGLHPGQTCKGSTSLYQTINVKVAQLSDSLRPHGLHSPWNSPGQNTGAGSHFLLQGIFPTRDRTQVSHRAGRLFQLSHQGSPRMLEWVAYPFSRGSSWPRDPTEVSCVAGRFFTRWATREVLYLTVTHWKTQRRNILLKAQLTHKTWWDNNK